MSTSTTTPGLFVVFEGGDGVGKSTQVVELVSRLRNRRIEPVVTRQPTPATRSGPPAPRRWSMPQTRPSTSRR